MGHPHTPNPRGRNTPIESRPEHPLRHPREDSPHPHEILTPEGEIRKIFPTRVPARDSRGQYPQAGLHTPIKSRHPHPPSRLGWGRRERSMGVGVALHHPFPGSADPRTLGPSDPRTPGPPDPRTPGRRKEGRTESGPLGHPLKNKMRMYMFLFPLPIGSNSLPVQPVFINSHSMLRQ
jgi:hypothetical protein